MTPDANDIGSPVHLRSASGLTAQVNHNGSIRRMDHQDIILNMYLGSDIEGGPTNLYLRRHGTVIESTPLLGPHSPGAIEFDDVEMIVRGEWECLRFALSFVLAESAPAWFWHLRIENVGTMPVSVDLVYAQDLALAHYGAVRTNEYYVSQYVDYTPLVDAQRGVVLAVRQNLAMGDRHPWALVGALGGGRLRNRRAPAARPGEVRRRGACWTGGSGTPGAATAARAFDGDPSGRAATYRARSGSRLGLLWLVRSGSLRGNVDCRPVIVERVLALPEAATPRLAHGCENGARPAATVFSARPLLESQDLDDTELASFSGPSDARASRRTESCSRSSPVVTGTWC